MKDLSSSRWLCISLPAIASTLGLMLLAATVLDVLADHAIGTEAQIAWQARLLEVDEALARSDLAAAERQWREAYAAALKSRHWQGMVAVGDTYRVLGARAGFRAASVAKARQAYLTALFRARREASLEGVLRAAERFAELGDREVVEQCIRVARQVAAQSRDPQAKEYVRTFTERWAADAQGSDHRGLTP
ncbi:MAG TPA: hypothetical protein VN977_04140 [Candidatus Binatia bacterium]|nr:hypothetical protein [Candidatus Binatia bacterium]